MKLVEANKLSELLRLAVTDAKKMEGLKMIKVGDVGMRLELDMGSWFVLEEYNPEEELDDLPPVCSVCMAGAVFLCEMDDKQRRDMVRRYQVDGFVALEIDHLPDAVKYRMIAIDELRKGLISQAYDSLTEAMENEYEEKDPEEEWLVHDMEEKWSEKYPHGTHQGRLSWEEYEDLAKELEEAGL